MPQLNSNYKRYFYCRPFDTLFTIDNHILIMLPNVLPDHRSRLHRHQLNR